MAQTFAVVLIVVLVVLRLMMPPIPGLIKTGFQRWGKRNTILFCSVSLTFALVAIFLSRH